MLTATGHRSYRIPKDNLVVYWRDLDMQQGNFPASFDIRDPNIDYVSLAKGQQGNFPASFDIRDPDIDYVSLAKGLGVPGMRVTQPGEMPEAVAAMLAHDGPYLIDLMLEDRVNR